MIISIYFKSKFHLNFLNALLKYQLKHKIQKIFIYKL